MNTVLIIIAFAIGGGVHVQPVAWYRHVGDCHAAAQVFNAKTYSTSGARDRLEHPEGGTTYALCVKGNML